MRRRAFLSQPSHFFVFWLVGYICKYRGYFDPFNQLTLYSLGFSLKMMLLYSCLNEENKDP